LIYVVRFCFSGLFVVDEMTKREITVTKAPTMICMVVFVADFIKMLHYSFGLEAKADHCK